jgi:hypothetical protein
MLKIEDLKELSRSVDHALQLALSLDEKLPAYLLSIASLAVSEKIEDCSPRPPGPGRPRRR